MENKYVLAVYGDVDHKLDIEYIKCSYTQIDFIEYNKFIKDIELNNNIKFDYNRLVERHRIKELMGYDKLYMEEIVFYYLCDKELVNSITNIEEFNLKQVLEYSENELKPLNIIRIHLVHDNKLIDKYLTIEELNELGKIIDDEELTNINKNDIESIIKVKNKVLSR